MNKFRQGQQLTVTGDDGMGARGRCTMEPIPAGTTVTVCDDFGQDRVNVFFGTQLRPVLRSNLTPVAK